MSEVQRSRTRFGESISKDHYLVEGSRGRLRMILRKFRFTPTKIEELPLVEPSMEKGKKRTQRHHWDDKQKALLLVVGMTTKTFYAEGRPRVKIGTFPLISVEQARRAAKKIEVERWSGTHHNKAKREAEAFREAVKRLTLRIVFEDMIDTKAASQKLKPSTAKQYRQLVEHNFTAWLDRPLTKITPTMVKDRLLEIRQRVVESKRKNARGDVADYAMRVLRSVFNFGKKFYPKIVTDNPVSAISDLWLPGHEREEIIKDLPAFFRGLDSLRSVPDEKSKQTRPNPVAADLIELMLFTGLRSTEARTLRWQQVDLIGQSLIVTETKNRKPLKLPVTDHVRRILDRRWQHAKKIKSPWVFPSDRRRGGQQVPVGQSIDYFLDRVLKAAGIKDQLNPHDLRRTFATIAGEVAPYAVYMSLLNHKPSDVTTKHYTMATWDAKWEAMTRITEYLRAKEAEGRHFKLTAEGA